MLTFIDSLRNKNEFYISSSKFRGERELPQDLYCIIHTDQSYSLDIYGKGITKGYKLYTIKNYAEARKVHFMSRNMKPFDRQIKKLWLPHEQVSYFMDNAAYRDIFGSTTEYLRVMPFDIEVGTLRGRAPSKEVDPIIMIGCMNPYDKNVVIIDEPTEEGTITKFLEIIIEWDPDVITGYFSKAFDVDFILYRMGHLGIKFPSKLHRMNENRMPASWILSPGSYHMNEIYMSLGYGRVHYDIYDTVQLDTSITSKNKKMKTVAEFFGSKTIFDIDDDDKQNMMELYEKDRGKLHEYLTSDILQTRFLFDNYFNYLSSHVYQINTSFDSLVNSRGKSTFPKMYMTKACIDRKSYPVFSNKERNKEVFRNLNKDKKKFRGAYTEIKRTGRFYNIGKIDFKSMYPSLMVTFNLSPETVKLVKIEDLKVSSKNPITALDKGAIKNNYFITEVRESNADSFTVAIPDELLKKCFVIKVDKKKKGILPSEVDQLFETRASYRSKMKNHKRNSPEWMKLNSQQLGTKIILNSLYGLMGSEYFDVGDINVAMLITGLGREITHFITSLLKEWVVEIDTDGLYIDVPADKNLDIKDINKQLVDAIKEKYWAGGSIPFEPIMILELEKQGYIGMFLAMKNYALMKPGTKNFEDLEITGNSMKGSSKPKFIEDIIKYAAMMILKGENAINIKSEIEVLCYSDKWKNEDFKISFTTKRDIEEYKMDGGLKGKVMELMEEESDSSLEDKAVALYSSFQKEVRDRIEHFEKKLASSDIKEKKFYKDRLKYIKSNKSGTTASFDRLWHIKGKNSKLKEECLFNGDYVKVTLSFLIGLADSWIIGTLGKYNNHKPNLYYNLHKIAAAQGIHIIKGDSIEYYYAAGSMDVQIYNLRNILKQPINRERYIEFINSSVSSMLGCIITQESEDLF